MEGIFLLGRNFEYHITYVMLIWHLSSLEMMYLYKYAERNQRSQGNPWSIRQTIVYQQISREGSHVWIVLHPRVSSVFHTRLQNLLTQPENVKILCKNPGNLHVLLISSYTDNWRWYLEQLGEGFVHTVI